MISHGREENGRFAQGNAGGPGRPRRAIEREYLAVLGDAVSIDDWHEVVQRAVVDAKAGDAKARDWLTKHLLGEKPPTLLGLAAKEARNYSSNEDVAAEAVDQELEDERDARFNDILERLQ
jgi:hypothetical protein